MSGEDNLIPMSERSKDEARELGRKGGKASGKSRRQRKSIREGLNAILSAPVKDKDVLKELKDAGADKDAQSLLLLRIYQQAINGDMQAAKLLLTAIGEADPAGLEIDRTRLEIAFIKAERESVLNDSSEPCPSFIEALRDTTDEVWNDYDQSDRDK